ncbi:MAG: outer membrane lipoprotein carrier protein LolA [Deltaproteobacteria bacterium]|nr:outer membrane lipoprotein carrier protein LolA [Deltaproteobacteria bacterium]
MWLALSIAVLAAEPAPLPPEAAAAWAELDDVQRLRAKFEQVQHRSILSTPLVSTGILAFARPGQVRWEVSAPVRSVFVLDGTRLATALPDLGHTESVDLGSNPEAARLVQGLMVWLGGDLAGVQRDYDVTWRAGPPAVVALTPRDAAVRSVLAGLELTIEGTPARIRHVKLLEPGGDRVEIALTAIEIDPVLPAGTFALP